MSDKEDLNYEDIISDMEVGIYSLKILARENNALKKENSEMERILKALLTTPVSADDIMWANRELDKIELSRIV